MKLSGQRPKRSPPLTAEELLKLKEMWLANVPVVQILREFKFAFGRLKKLITLCGLPQERDHYAYAPTPEEIAECCAAIKESWTEDEKLLRARKIQDPLPASFYQD